MDEFLAEQSKTWKAYSKTTPEYCQETGTTFDPERCASAWLDYIEVYRRHGFPLPVTPKYLWELDLHSSTGQST